MLQSLIEFLSKPDMDIVLFCLVAAVVLFWFLRRYVTGPDSDKYWDKWG
jgi:hypothetical protein